jgi:hypothetical protein
MVIDKSVDTNTMQRLVQGKCFDILLVSHSELRGWERDSRSIYHPKLSAIAVVVSGNQPSGYGPPL